MSDTTIVFLLFPGITQLDFTAPAQALSSWIAGRVFDTGVGSQGYLAMLAPVAVGTLLVVILWRRPEPQPVAA